MLRKRCAIATGLCQTDAHHKDQHNTISKDRSDHDHGRLLPSGNGAQDRITMKSQKLADSSPIERARDGADIRETVSASVTPEGQSL